MHIRNGKQVSSLFQLFDCSILHFHLSPFIFSIFHLSSSHSHGRGNLWPTLHKCTLLSTSTSVIQPLAVLACRWPHTSRTDSITMLHYWHILIFHFMQYLSCCSLRLGTTLYFSLFTFHSPLSSVFLAGRISIQLKTRSAGLPSAGCTTCGPCWWLHFTPSVRT